MDLNEKNVLVFGAGISGEAAAGLLLRQGARVILYDGNKNLDLQSVKSRIADSVRDMTDRPEENLKIVSGEFPEEVVKELSLAVISPGVPADLPVVEQMRNLDIPVWGEIELAYAFGRGDVLAITGTNGKTTTTALLGEIMANYKESVFVVGNIGNPYTSIVPRTEDSSVIVAEISSFQLETIHTFRPKVSAV